MLLRIIRSALLSRLQRIAGIRHLSGLFSLSPLLIVLLGCLAMPALRAEPIAPLIELTQSDVENLGPQVLLLADDSGQLSPFDILQPEYAGEWTKHRAHSISRGYDDTPFWIQFRLDAAQSIHKEWHLVLSNALLDYVDVYQVFGNSGPRLIYRSGLQRPSQSRTEDRSPFLHYSG